MSDVIKERLHQSQVGADSVVTGVSGHSVIIKNIVLPPMSSDELEESIDWHAEEHIPYDLADVSLDYQITGTTHDSTQVLIAACKRESIDNIRQADPAFRQTARRDRCRYIRFAELLRSELSAGRVAGGDTC